jgi:hypothetical protein
MHHGVDLMLLEKCAHRGLVADIALHENIPGVPVQAREVVDIAGIGQGIEHHHPPLLGFSQPVAHEVRANEAGAAGYEHVTGFEAHPA